MLEQLTSTQLSELYVYWEIEGEENTQRDLVAEAMAGLKGPK